jgi:hypothetical protein
MHTRSLFVARTALATVLLLPLSLTPAVAQQSGALRPVFEAHLWGGYSAFSGTAPTQLGARAGEIGLRSAELALWPTRSLRVFARYDNTLSLDNLALIQAGRRLPTYHGGAQVNWTSRATTVLDVAHRTLPGGIAQTMLGGEQVAFLRNGTALKLGGWVGPRSDQRTEWLAHAGVNLAAGHRLRLEPTLFLARSGVVNEQQWRALLAGEFPLTSRITVGGGAAVGHNHSVNARYTGAAQSNYLRLTTSLRGMQRVHLLVNRESAAGASTLTTVAAGLSLGASRR